MPIYEYECEKCGERFEMFCSISDSDKAVQCPVCGENQVHKILSAFGISGSGSGCAPTPSGGST
jgi:putative FmdB family regulatory protein